MAAETQPLRLPLLVNKLWVTRQLRILCCHGGTGLRVKPKSANRLTAFWLAPGHEFRPSVSWRYRQTLNICRSFRALSCRRHSA